MNVPDIKCKHKLCNISSLITYFLALTSLLSCHQDQPPRQVERAFYFWKSVFRLSPFEEQQLEALQVNTLYVKCFDVDWDDRAARPIPIAKLQNSGYRLKPGIRVIPTVFITTECLEKMNAAQVPVLAVNMYDLIMELCRSNEFLLPLYEIQLDCDWTATTRETYFALLRSFKEKSRVTLSATIRLHQVKFTSRSGIPPVDKGLLMCYNMGNLKNPATKNSIIETGELKKYVGKLNAYPLPLDIGLPLFEWKVLFRQNQFHGLIRDMPDSILLNAHVQRTGQTCRLLSDTLLSGYPLFKGDVIRSETSEYSEILLAATVVTKLLKNTQTRVALYHLDSLLLSKYSTNELENIFNRLR
ncbi:MAG: hypothetical protein IPP31_00790 [Chitinophagaceae bacterium]|nr:hypothetical protein [Chitinophagaceae bacterium]